MLKQLVKEFVAQQKVWSINTNGTVERNVIVKEFSKFLHEQKVLGSFKKSEIIEAVKEEYAAGKNKKEFFESLKPEKFKYTWE